MIEYAICQIGGKQYKVVPGKPFEVDLQSETQNLKLKPLMVVEDGKIKIGKPFISIDLALKILESKSKNKIRVTKYHAKANYRKVIGFRRKVTRVVLEA